MGSSSSKEEQKPVDLDYSNKNADKFPKELLKLKQTLQSLDISNNELSEFPSKLIKFEQMKLLNISNNSISLFPSNLPPNLETILAGEHTFLKKATSSYFKRTIGYFIQIFRIP